jgi:hypothetical protein
MLIVGHQNYCDIVQPSEKLQKKKKKKKDVNTLGCNTLGLLQKVSILFLKSIIMQCNDS